MAADHLWMNREEEGANANKIEFNERYSEKGEMDYLIAIGYAEGCSLKPETGLIYL